MSQNRKIFCLRDEKQSVMGTMLQYSMLTILLTVLFCMLLFLSGLSNDHIQSNINSNINKSLNQLKMEGVYPQIISSNDYSYRLDNFTDITILQESLLMNTSSNPMSIFTNPRLSKSYENAEYPNNILALEEVAKTNEGNSFYTYYWLGIRVLIRPLLLFLTYPAIRGVLALVFLSLWLVALLSIYRALGIRYTFAFFLSVACMNIPIVISEIQFVPCFYIMFITVFFLIRCYKHEREVLLAFFITGACTQYFDFYTYPLITLGFPLVILVGLMSRESAHARFLKVIKCTFVWFLAYGLFWIVRLLLVETFTPYEAVATAFARFFTWTGNTNDERYMSYTPMYSLRLCFDTLFQSHNTFVFIVVGTGLVLALLLNLIKHRIKRPSPLFIVIMIMPFMWIVAASRATGNHFWYQYRLLSVFIFACLSFILDMLPNKSMKPIDSSPTNI